MILVIHRDAMVRADVGQACDKLGVSAVMLESVAAMQEYLRFNRPDVLVLDGDGVPDGGKGRLRALRSDPLTAHLPIVWLEARGLRSVEAGEDEIIANPNVWMRRQDIGMRLEMELRRLLADAAEQEVHEPSSGGEEEEGGPRRILVVDDSLTFRMQMQEALHRAGYAVVLAETGEAGLLAAFREPFSAAIVDSQLPGIQGEAVIRRLRVEPATRRLPCLLLTASEDPNSELEALQAGADTFVHKDEEMDVLILRLATIVRNATEPSALEFQPPAARRIWLMGEFFRDSTGLRTALTGDGSIVLQESDTERLLRAEEDMLPDAVLLATEYARALEICTRMKSSTRTDKVRLLVMDVGGDAALEKAGTSERQMAVLQAGADDHLPASLPSGTIRARVQTQLRRKQMEDENRTLHDRLLQDKLEADSQRKLAIARMAHADEMRVAKEALEVEASEAELARLQLERVMEGIPQIVLVANARGDLLAYNRRWQEYTGSEPPSKTRAMWESVVHTDDLVRLLTDRRRALETGCGYAGEYRLRSKTGNFRWFYVHAIPTVAEGEDAAAPPSPDDQWLGTCTDIHDRKLAEEALRRTEKLAATGRLAASIAHEINNPLEAVTNLLFLLEATTQTLPETHEYVVTAQRELERVSEIAKKTLTFYRESSTAAPVDLGALVRETMRVYESKLKSREIALTIDLRTEAQPVGLSGELRQIVSNLIANAIDASPMKSEVCVRVRASHDWKTQREGVRLLVMDHGTGIAKQLREEIFKPFVTTKGKNGTGLGLWVASSIAERHNGSLRFRSSQRMPGNGTCFSLFLPMEGEVALASDSIGEMMKQIGGELLGQ